ncbi:MSMEG_0570 family nitrogen starvation response protein [Roseinatronobacter alkalisoli]|uniref:MSMEG_0570 family nitrogen starvation response protein n=1 Tax=Roseinatronobacter alkalisoli TaxID=3028235 RepID=A0ABT5TDD2_9RHOB|nr:MSMEG_0570 family nitrogen starvation response protein [Roseinatronobacter sp. HJB301]MDD7973138.1 MSMEG_0570 family nitrogen starvation response protein [Roseinatronobacter sp. HJB301]
MPETYWTIRWPDGHEERCYSPSSVIAETFSAGQSYPLPAFMQSARRALEQASARVEQKYGFACSLAMDQLDRLERRAATFAGQKDARILCLAIST